MNVLPAAMLTIALLVTACDNKQAEPPADVADPSASLHALFDEFSNEERERLTVAFKDDIENKVIPSYKRISALSTNLFDVFPKGGLEVRRVEPFREASAGGASYRTGTPDGSAGPAFFTPTLMTSSRRSGSGPGIQDWSAQNP